MVSASMALQDESGSTDSETTLPMAIGKKVPLDMEVCSKKSVKLKEELQSGEDHALKVRKPYTITKQRERWTEDEHKKFLEALKLYGRAWRRIEEYVGTKTAVQIRSHAQKFFSKVARECNGDEGSVKPIEIPPPRPKRKPLHPYPRKLSTSVKSGSLALEKPSVAPNTCLPTEANHSPTSVLSAFSSDAPGATDSNTPEVNTSPSSSQVNNGSKQDEKSPLKLELFLEDKSFVKEGSVEVSSTRCLKLFGKTFLVTDSCRPSSATHATCKMQPANDSDGKLSQALPWNFTPIKYSQADLDNSWSALPFGTHATLYCLPRQSGKSDTTESNPSHSLPWWKNQGVASFPFVQVHSPIPIKASFLGNTKEVQDTEILQDGSSSNSNVESESAEADRNRNLEVQSSQLLHVESESAEADRNRNLEVQSSQLLLAAEERALASSRPGKTSFLELRASSGKCTKGFVPYKRCLADRDVGSVVPGEEREKQRIRLCL
ncbi:hypothetical protein ACH5RR_013454 [Cinchona calisaya]|uniref:Uncharacterized protein n=1 Tax=Cinchona calisaya TaxID=153742 RepID=A0ABD3A2R5_9GENT